MLAPVAGIAILRFVPFDPAGSIRFILKANA
jgi:hypothetical protein